MSSQGVLFDDIKCVAKANSILISLIQILEPDLGGRAGGYLCVADRKGLPVFLDRLGEIPEEKLNQYYTNALEKALRLSYAWLFAGHNLSRDSRDESRQRWIGAVVGNLWIWSFSGFPEDCDEIFTVALALGYGDITYGACQRLRATGYEIENPHFRKVDSYLRGIAGVRTLASID